MISFCPWLRKFTTNFMKNSGLIILIPVRVCRYAGFSIFIVLDLFLQGWLCNNECLFFQMKTLDSNQIYSEVQGIQHIFKYRVHNAGCCKIILHPKWGSSCYPATIFTTAPLEQLISMLESLKSNDNELPSEPR